MSQMQVLLVAHGFELDGGKFTSPLVGYTPVAVLYALMVWGISYGVYELQHLLADCACVPRPPHTRTPTTARRPTSRVVYRARSYGLMRLATYGTCDLTRLSNEERAASQLRGQRILQESRNHATEVYKLLGPLRASPQTAIRVELLVPLDSIGRKEPLCRIITITGLECSSRTAFAAGELKGVFDDLWDITNQGVGRTAAEVLHDQARAARPSNAPFPLRRGKRTRAD